ncbi:inactive ubiquitin carboxyl-terminal hydrolase MINDY-4B [Nelusetta ayraudi]|uniref:inactive ubiquitin carboxyl-terminal hydrolase MINDY-4B n=1 Tax=Nelusetta ayraudi TaxID=303726 RepID=UPI003F6ED9D7
MSSQQEVDVELQQILVQVSHLENMRKLTEDVSCSPQRLVEEEEGEGPSIRLLPQACPIPRRLAIGRGVGGAPVTPELVEGVRNVLFGGNFHVFGYDWRRSVFQFREPRSPLSYALQVDKGGAGAIQMVIQARILKHLLFIRPSNSAGLQSLTTLDQKDQDSVLAAALSDSLWLAGQELGATVTLVSEDYCITPHLDYKLDNFTEKLQLFTFSQKEEVQKFLLDHIQSFTQEGSHGVILFLYSLICSRTVTRLKGDLDSSTSHLLCSSQHTCRCGQALLLLLLTGRASPNTFNGTRHCREDGRPLQRPLQGVLSRSDVGYLHWSREQTERRTLPAVGSMLKTPHYPVWLCSTNGRHWVAFCTKRSLLSDWRTELVFQLCCYDGQAAQLTVDTRSHHREAVSTEADPEERLASLEMTIRTKWAGASVTWNNTTPLH